MIIFKCTTLKDGKLTEKDNPVMCGETPCVLICDESTERPLWCAFKHDKVIWDIIEGDLD